MTSCNVGPTSNTLNRRCINVIQMSCVCWEKDFLSNIVHLSNVGSMLSQRRRRWPNIKTSLDQCLVWVVSCNQFSGYINAVNLYSIGYCWPTLDRPRHAYFAVGLFFNHGRPTVISQVWPSCWLWGILIMIGCVLSQLKPSELYILCCEKGHGLRPRPFPQLRM